MQAWSLLSRSAAQVVSMVNRADTTPNFSDDSCPVIEYCEYPPSPQAMTLVKCYRTLVGDKPLALPQTILREGHCELIINHETI